MSATSTDLFGVPVDPVLERAAFQQHVALFFLQALNCTQDEAREHAKAAMESVESGEPLTMSYAREIVRDELSYCAEDAE